MMSFAKGEGEQQFKRCAPSSRRSEARADGRPRRVIPGPELCFCLLLRSGNYLEGEKIYSDALEKVRLAAAQNIHFVVYAVYASCAAVLGDPRLTHAPPVAQITLINSANGAPPVGAVVLLCNRAACRAATGRYREALAGPRRACACAFRTLAESHRVVSTERPVSPAAPALAQTLISR